MEFLQWFLRRGVKIPAPVSHATPSKTPALFDQVPLVALPHNLVPLPPPSKTKVSLPVGNNLVQEILKAPKFLQETGAGPHVMAAILGDIVPFAAGSPVAIPPFPLGAATLNLTVQKVTTESPFHFGSLMSSLNSIFSDIETFATDGVLALPTFTEPIGSTIIQFSGTVRRVSPAPPAALPPTSAQS